MSAVAAGNAANEADFDLVHADLLRFFPDLVRELGGDPDGMMWRAGQESPRGTSFGRKCCRGDRSQGAAAGMLPGQPARLTYRAWITLMEHAATELRCLDFGMRLARRQGGGQLGPMSRVMRTSRTFGDALEYVAHHLHAHSLAAGIRLIRGNNDGSLFVSHDILVDGLPNQRQAIEQAMLLGHLLANEMTGGQARVREVLFRHQPLSPRATYRAYFGAPVRFDAHADGVIFSGRDLRACVVDHDAHRHALATSFIDARFTRVTPPMHAQVRGLVARLIETADCTSEHVCCELGLHPRTLQRRLKAEGKSFESIKDEVRRDVALRYLQETDHPLTVIAAKLGYSEQSVLTRSCLRWFSACPSDVRAQASH